MAAPRTMHLTSKLRSWLGRAPLMATGMAASALVLLAASELTAATAAVPQERSRPDQVHIRNQRTGRTSIISGTVTANRLDDVLVSIARGGENKLGSDGVERILWGEVPPSFRDGRTYFERGDWASAAQEFRLAAGDASAREVVQAVARLRAAQSLLRSGAQDPAHFTEAVAEVRTFLADYPNNRDVPVARMTEARALLLSGKPDEAGAAYRAVFSELSGDSTTEGYAPGTCMQAGMLAARCMLHAQDTLAAREILTSITTAVGPMIEAQDENSSLRAQLTRIRDEALLGGGFAELAAGNSKEALTYFRGEQTRLDSSASQTRRMVVLLGLAEALFAEGQFLEAEYLFANVSALDHGAADRVSQAQLRMAQCELELKHSDSRERARTLLKSVIDNHGDTPSAPVARDVLASL